MKASHKDRYKNTGSTIEKLRGERLQESQNLRKRRRDEELRKLRNLRDIGEIENFDSNTSIFDSDLIECSFSENVASRIKAIRIYGAILGRCFESEPSTTAAAMIQDLVTLGVVPAFCECFCASALGSPLCAEALAFLTRLAAAADDQSVDAWLDAAVMRRLTECLWTVSSSITPLCLEMTENAIILLNIAIRNSQKIYAFCVELNIASDVIQLFRQSNRTSVEFRKSLLIFLSIFFQYPVADEHFQQLFEYVDLIREILTNVYELLGGLDAADVSMAHISAKAPKGYEFSTPTAAAGGNGGGDSCARTLCFSQQQQTNNIASAAGIPPSSVSGAQTANIISDHSNNKYNTTVAELPSSNFARRAGGDLLALGEEALFSLLCLCDESSDAVETLLATGFLALLAAICRLRVEAPQFATCRRKSILVLYRNVYALLANIAKWSDTSEGRHTNLLFDTKFAECLWKVVILNDHFGAKVKPNADAHAQGGGGISDTLDFDMNGVEALANKNAARHAFEALLLRDVRMPLANGVRERGYVPMLVEVLGGAPYRLRREAVAALHILLLYGSSDTVAHIVDCGAILPLCDMLTVMDVESVLCSMECLSSILSHGRKRCRIDGLPTNPYKTAAEEAGILDKLDFLTRSQSACVFAMATFILDRYFETGGRGGGGGDDDAGGVGDVIDVVDDVATTVDFGCVEVGAAPPNAAAPGLVGGVKFGCTAPISAASTDTVSAAIASILEATRRE